MGDNSYCAIGFLPAFPRHPRGILNSLFVERYALWSAAVKSDENKKRLRGS